MEAKVFMGQYLILVMLLLAQLRGYKSCIEKERMALLELKTYLASQPQNPFYHITSFTWSTDTTSDCCRWEGVKCNLTNGRVIKLTLLESMFPLDRALLNLSLLHPFEELRSLNLSGGDRFVGLFDDVEGYKSLRKLKNLEILDLSSNNFNKSIFPFLNAATSLTTLFLGRNYMPGPLPAKELKDLTKLELLDLSENGFNGSIRVRGLSTMRKLKALDLSGNQFSDSMELQGICKLKNMQELDLSENELVGQFPSCLTSLTRLRVLDLSSNQLSGNLPSALGNLESIEYLSLINNNFEGFFSLGWLANISELKVLKLDSLQVDLESSWKTKQLSVIVLRSCNLEKVPEFLLHQKDLRQVDLSGSKIFGSYPSWLLENNTKLEVLLLQNNSFTSFQLPESAHNLLFLDVSVNKFKQVLPDNIGWILPHLRCMNLTENVFEGNLPSSLGNMRRLKFLDISRNNFSGELPKSFVEGCYSMIMLKLSHNNLRGEILPESTNFTNIFWLSMDNNQFTGKIGQGLRRLRNLEMLDISNNNLTGVIPSWISELQWLSTLLISNNSLEGEIPISLFNQSDLYLLDVSSNSLSGDIPDTLLRNVNSVDSGVILLLQDNNLSGAIPAKLLGNVSILDLRNNRLSGDIPEFINTGSISMLLLRGNNLTGIIPSQLCDLRNIHLLDLANNRLDGSIPSCLVNTSFGSGNAFNYYYDSSFSSISQGYDAYFKSLFVLETFFKVYDAGTQTKIEFATKHRYDAYMGGNLRLLFGLDLSENELSGEIPEELGGLVELHAFNLSHNKLSGAIPKSISGLKNVESLDLSFNYLQGLIPQELKELSNLAVFKVSYNNLSGIIPQGRQFNTFNAQSYLGNPLLCGQPTNRSCNSVTFQEPDDEVKEDDSQIDMVSFYWSFAAAYVTILLGIFASLSFDSPWSRFWFYMVDVFIHKARNLLWCQIH